MKQKRKYHEISDDECNTSMGSRSINGGAKRTKISVVPAIPELDPDDEIWLVKIPGHLNPDQLYNQKLAVKSKTSNADRIKFLNGESVHRTYEPQVTKWKKNNLLTMLNQDENGAFTISNLKCKGEITLVEEVNVPSIGDIQVPPKCFVQPPSDLHWRHPFFGRTASCNDPVINSTSAKDPNNTAFESSKPKKKKKDKKHRSGIDEVPLQDGKLQKVKVEETSKTVLDNDPVISSALTKEAINLESKATKPKKKKKDKKALSVIDEVRLEDGELKKVKTEQSLPESEKKKKHKKKRENS